MPGGYGTDEDTTPWGSAGTSYVTPGQTSSPYVSGAGPTNEPNYSSGSDDYGIGNTGEFVGNDYGPTDYSTVSTPEMETGYGSWFGANTASTGSSQLVQTTIQNEIDKAVAAAYELHKAGQVKDEYGRTIPWQASTHNKVIQDVFRKLYPRIDQYTEEEFVSLYGEESRGDYIAANAAMQPGYANLMGGTTPGQYPEIFESYYQPYGGSGGGGGGGGRYSSGSGGSGSGGGGGSRMQFPGAGGDAYMRGRWGQSDIQRRYIDRMRGMNRGGIVSLC